MDTTLTVAAVVLLLLPGWALWLRIVGPQPSPEVAISGLPFALALAMVALHLCAYFSLTAFVVLWLPAAAAAAYSLYRQRPALRFDRALIALAALAAAIRFAPALLEDFPPGWDPYFHLLVSRLIEADWAHVAMLSPFEDIRINYPTGTHLLLALVTGCSGVSRYSVFQTLMVLFASLSCLQVYAWVHAATDNRRWALYALAAYGFLAVQGSLGYYAWGGLSNLVGMYILAGCLTIVAQRDAGERRWWALAPMYLGVMLASHHVLMVAFAVLLGMLLWLARDPQRRADARRLALGGCAAAALGVPFLLHHFLTGPGIHATGLLRYDEPPNTLWHVATSFGLAFFASILAGAVIFALAPRRWPLRAELLLPAAIMLVLFALFEYGGKLLMLWLYQRPLSPFTPSRFLTDAVYPLSAFSALLFLALERRIGRSVLPAVALLFLTNHGFYRPYFDFVIDPNRLAAYRWVEANTRPDTLVFDQFVHAPVLTNRAASETALPSSELSVVAPKRLLMQRMQSGEVPIEATDYPVVRFSYGAAAPHAPGSTLLLQRGPVTVLDLNPRVPARLP
jgi:hypothetical protein